MLTMSRRRCSTVLLLASIAASIVLHTWTDRSAFVPPTYGLSADTSPGYAWGEAARGPSAPRRWGRRGLGGRSFGDQLKLPASGKVSTRASPQDETAQKRKVPGLIPKIAILANSAVYVAFGLACSFFTERMLGYVGVTMAPWISLKERLIFQLGVQEIGIIACFTSLLPISMMGTVKKETLKNMCFAMGVANVLVLIEVYRRGLFVANVLVEVCVVAALAACSFAASGMRKPSCKLSAIKWEPLVIYQAVMVLAFGPLTYLFPKTMAKPFLNLIQVSASSDMLQLITYTIVVIGIFKIIEGLVEYVAVSSDDGEARKKFVRMASTFYGVQLGFDILLLLASRLVGLSQQFGFSSAVIAGIGVACAHRATMK